MKKYKFRKLKHINPEENFYVCNRAFENDFEPYSFYKEEEVLGLLTKFLHAFSPVEKSITEMKKFIYKEFEIYTKEINNRK